MKILISEDNVDTRRMLEVMLVSWGYEVVGASSGSEAWQILQGEDAPSLSIIDVMMPDLSGIEICRRIRQTAATASSYIILLTAKSGTENVIKGLQTGADDYMTKPFDPGELRARVQAGVRIVELQQRLNKRVEELEEALSHVEQLQGLLPICSYCKNIRDDQNYWQRVENYIAQHSKVEFSHGICPDCYLKFVLPEIAKLKHHKEEGHISYS